MLFLAVFPGLISSTGFARKKNRREALNPPPPPGIGDMILTRKNWALYSLEQRHAFYPYRDAAQVQLVSFCLVDSMVDFAGRIFTTPEADSAEEHKVRKGDLRFDCRIPVTGDSVDYARIAQSKTLTPQETDWLTDILYNEKARWNMGMITAAGCYEPRNGVIFLNNAGRVLGYIEICFTCGRMEYSDDRVQPVELSSYTWTELREFFQKPGLRTDAIADKPTSTSDARP